MHLIASHQNLLSPRASAAGTHTTAKPDRGGILRRWSRMAAQKWKRRKMIAALRALDHRILREMGIFQDDIKRIVNGFDERELGMVPFATTPTQRLKDQDIAWLTA